jgi:predicted ATPase
MTVSRIVTANKAGIIDRLREQADGLRHASRNAGTKAQANSWLAEARGVDWAIELLEDWEDSQETSA